MAEFNAGYEIVKSETYLIGADDKESRIVLGEHKGENFTQYATWECVRHPEDGTADYFWGHYFDKGHQAMADYHRRLADHYCPSDEG